ncbi:Txe/YoeB family addiction module toxin [Levilactobacillus parabrevis]|uniref:Txe/YoeB family addiction module toxin n=1 Tax=Levilactobacillus parabrevis TaxID=357278 RepID=UPI003757DC1E
MDKKFTENAWQDYLWLLRNNKRAVKRVNLLLKDVSRTPFEGIGKPEPLHGNFTGYWSRRVNEKDRLIYTVTDEVVTILACRTHYNEK